MAHPETLVPGNCYFSVCYYDKDLVLPMIDTLVNVGQETNALGARGANSRWPTAGNRP